MPERSRLVVGATVFVIGFATPLLVPVITSTDLPAAWKGVLSTLLVFGIPELFMLIAVAILGKSGYSFLKNKVYDFLKRQAPPDKVGPVRYRIGLVMFCLPLAALGVLSAAFVMAFKRGDPVAMLIHMASLILAGAYFPRELLPGWAQAMALLIPHTHGLEAVRLAALDGAGFGDAAFQESLGALGVCAAVFVPLAGVAWGAAVRHARVRGAICHV